jgi:hypothetical protein
MTKLSVDKGYSLERVKRYRRLADEADCWAREARGATRDSYALSAMEWRDLADHIESCIE